VDTTWLDVIAERVQRSLGPAWDAGPAQAADENAFIAPRLVDDHASYVAMVWARTDDAAVATGDGQVVAEGKVNGRELSHVASLDDVLAFVVKEAPRLLAKGPKRRWTL